MGAPNFWDDADKARTVSEDAAGMKKKLEAFFALESRSKDVIEGVALAKEFDDEELAREANTIGSKSSVVAIAHTVVEVKTRVERLRELVQNLE